jgi:hypothetical protein
LLCSAPLPPGSLLLLPACRWVWVCPFGRPPAVDGLADGEGTVLGVVRLVLQLRSSGTLVLAHLVEVDGVPGIVAAPGAELGHGRAFLHVQERTIQ